MIEKMIDPAKEAYSTAIAARLRTEGFEAEAVGHGIMIYPDKDHLDRDMVLNTIPQVGPIVTTVEGQGAVFLQLEY